MGMAVNPRGLVVWYAAVSAGVQGHLEKLHYVTRLSAAISKHARTLQQYLVEGSSGVSRMMLWRWQSFAGIDQRRIRFIVAPHLEVIRQVRHSYTVPVSLFERFPLKIRLQAVNLNR